MCKKVNFPNVQCKCMTLTFVRRVRKIDYMYMLLRELLNKQFQSQRVKECKTHMRIGQVCYSAVEFFCGRLYFTIELYTTVFNLAERVSLNIIRTECSI